MNIVFLGAPGSGKGTQASRLTKALGILSISTGEVLRKEILSGSQVGKLAKSYVDSGSFVPDEIMIKIVADLVSDQQYKSGFILDGFPRNIDQAMRLDENLFRLKKEINIALNFELSDDILIKRISGRFSCADCGLVYNDYFTQPLREGICDQCCGHNFNKRSDDDEAVVKKRLSLYRQTTKDLVEYYKVKDLLITIDATKDANAVFQDVAQSCRISG